MRNKGRATVTAKALMRVHDLSVRYPASNCLRWLQLLVDYQKAKIETLGQEYMKRQGIWRTTANVGASTCVKVQVPVEPVPTYCLL